MKNPWLDIPAKDYEGHMSAPHVGQLQFLNYLLSNLLVRYKPESILIPGCTTGNGFEHIDFKVTRTVVGIDINEKYLAIARERFPDERIKFIADDVCTHDFGNQRFDLIHCALVCEYVDVPKCLSNLKKYLNGHGVLSVLLQIPSINHTMISETCYESLNTLSSIMKLVDVNHFQKIIENMGLHERSNDIINLESGKSFYFSQYSSQ